MKIPKSCELLVLQDFVEYLVTWKFQKLYLIRKKISEKYFEHYVLILIYFLCWKRILKQKGFGKEFHMDK